MEADSNVVKRSKVDEGKRSKVDEVKRSKVEEEKQQKLRVSERCGVSCSVCRGTGLSGARGGSLEGERPAEGPAQPVSAEGDAAGQLPDYPQWREQGEPPCNGCKTHISLSLSSC